METTPQSLKFTRGTVFRHGRWLEPGTRHERAVCRVTAIRHGEVYYGFGADATKSSYHATPEYLLENGAVIMETPAKKEPQMSAKTFTFRPVGLDVFDRRPNQPQPGTRVVKTQPAGCPRNGTMGHCFVADAETGEFYGLVLVASLAS